jgi:DNA modification methylase
MELDTNHPYAGLQLSLFQDNLQLPRHRWFEFKEGFSEKLVRVALKETAQGNKSIRILDPFAGVGTALVAAGRMGIKATGIEVNPFLSFACNAKTRPDGWRQANFQRRLDAILRSARYEVPSPLEGVSTFTEGPRTQKWLFNRSVLRGFESLSQALKVSGPYYQPLKLALLASLADCCNAKRDGKCLRYRKDWQSLGYTSADLRAVFEARAKAVFEDVHTDPFDHKGIRVIRGDARKELAGLSRDSFDIVITSPPYLNSFDYSDVYRPELFAGKFVRSNDELRQVRLGSIRSHVQVKWEAAKEVASPLVSQVISRVGEKTLWDRRLPAMIQSYFADIGVVLGLCRRLVRDPGYAWIVVGTSAYGGVQVAVDVILADIASRKGWSVKGLYVLRELRAAGQQWTRIKGGPSPPLRETLIVLQRESG